MNNNTTNSKIVWKCLCTLKFLYIYICEYKFPKSDKCKRYNKQLSHTWNDENNVRLTKRLLCLWALCVFCRITRLVVNITINGFQKIKSSFEIFQVSLLLCLCFAFLIKFFGVHSFSVSIHTHIHKHTHIWKHVNDMHTQKNRLTLYVSYIEPTERLHTGEHCSYIFQSKIFKNCIWFESVHEFYCTFIQWLQWY